MDCVVIVFGVVDVIVIAKVKVVVVVDVLVLRLKFSESTFYDEV